MVAVIAVCVCMCIEERGKRKREREIRFFSSHCPSLSFLLCLLFFSRIRNNSLLYINTTHANTLIANISVLTERKPARSKVRTDPFNDPSSLSFVSFSAKGTPIDTHTHTHTSLYMYIYISISHSHTLSFGHTIADQTTSDTFLSPPGPPAAPPPSVPPATKPIKDMSVVFVMLLRRVK